MQKNAIRSLSKLIMFLFQPCLLFVNVAATIGNPGHSLSKLLVLPVFAVFLIFFGAIIGKGMAKLLNLPAGSPEGRELRVCASFGNSGPLPLLFAASLFGSHPDSSMAANAVAYISFYLLGYSPFFWTVGYTMMVGRPPAAEAMSEEDEKRFRSMDPVQKFVASCLRAKDNPTVKRIVSPQVIGCATGMMVGLAPWGRALLLGKSAPLSPIYNALESLGSAYTPSAILVLAGSLARPPPTNKKNKTNNRTKPKINTDTNNTNTNTNINVTTTDTNADTNADTNTNINNTNTDINTNTKSNTDNNMNTSTNVDTNTNVTNTTTNINATTNTNTTYAIAMDEALEAAEVGERTATFQGAAPPGYGSLPSTTSPHKGAGGGGDAGGATKTAPKNSAFYKKVAAIMASRFLIMPLIAAGMLVLGLKMELIPSDRLIWFVLLMEACMPSSQNSVVMLQMENRSDLAASLATTLGAVYLLSAVPMALLLSAILEFVHI